MEHTALPIATGILWEIFQSIVHRCGFVASIPASRMTAVLLMARLRINAEDELGFLKGGVSRKIEGQQNPCMIGMILLYQCLF